MPVQQQMSSFAKKLGGRVAQANAEHMDKPVDTGDRRLPSGIRDGIAKLSAMYTKEYADGDWKGQTFFRASAIVISPPEHNGEKIAGLVTSVMIPLCDQPAKQGSQRKARSFSDNWYDFQNIFKLLGVAPCPETPQTDPTGQKTEAYFFAAMKTLTDPVRLKTNPVYISFSTRGWTPPPTPQQPKPAEMVFETWHGLAELNGQIDPAGGVTESPSAVQPGPADMPPNHNAPVAPPPSQAVPPSPPTPEPVDVPDAADLVAALVEVAMDDPEGATEEGASASSQLEEMAWEAGWSKEQTASATDWAQVGDMALNPPQPVDTAATGSGGPVVGSRWMFAKRTKEGAKLKNNKGEEFPPQEVEVVTVDTATKTCTVKTVKDGKAVVDIRSKQPIAVKFEWLENIEPY